MKINYKSLILYALFPLVIGTIVGLLTDTSTYNGNVPAIIFPIVWSILYVLMGISSYLVKDNKELMIIYIINLIVNYAWSFIFFNLEQFENTFSIISSTLSGIIIVFIAVQSLNAYVPIEIIFDGII